MAVLFTRRGKAAEPSPSLAVITITGSGALTTTGSNMCASVTIGGTVYFQAATVEVTVGDVILLTISYLYENYSKIIIDGVTVATGMSTYEYTVTSDCTIELYYNAYGRITVTTS